MDIKRLMAELIAERARLDRAIAALKGLDQNESPRKRGRPVGSHNKLKAVATDLPQDFDSDHRKSAAVFSRN